MKDLQSVYRECMREVENANIETGKIVEVKTNPRYTRVFGTCRKVIGGYRIEVSEGMVADSTPVMYLKNTLIHEILHTVDGCFNHGKEWKTKAEIMNRKYGYNITRTSNEEEDEFFKGLNTKGEKRKPRYRMVCKNGHAINYYRWCSTLENSNRYRCKTCKENFKVISLVEDITILSSIF